MLKFRYFIRAIFLSILFVNNLVAADDTFIANKASETPVIDGIGNESYWADAQWYPINYVWIPYNTIVSPTDFSGRFKLSWNENRLLLLVEIVDDSLYDTHVNPFDNYWNDDCVEVFLDEDHAGGIYQNTFNAFAYHISLTFDVVDPWSNVLLNDHIQAARTKHDSLYTWELSIKVFDKNFKTNGSHIPVALKNNKEMGFSLAYCDNDRSPERENFIGSKYLPVDSSNDSYLNASRFGTLILKDPNVSINRQIAENSLKCEIYPNPATDYIYYKHESNKDDVIVARIRNLSGQVLYSKIIDNNSDFGIIPLIGIEKGIYIVEIIGENQIYSNKLIIL